MFRLLENQAGSCNLRAYDFNITLNKSCIELRKNFASFIKKRIQVNNFKDASARPSNP